MKLKLAASLLLALCSTRASAQLKSLQIGSLIYIGEDSAGASYFTIHLGETRFKQALPLASPITFNSDTVVVAGATGSFGPHTFQGPFTTPTELLFNTGTVSQGGHPCPCLVAAMQFIMSADPTITITLKNGETIKTSSTVNVYLEAPHGMSAIQLQQWVPIVVHAVP
jgi:hypothetical protein